MARKKTTRKATDRKTDRVKVPNAVAKDVEPEQQQKKKVAPARSAGIGAVTEFPIVAMGASAGGLEAIEGFFARAQSDRNVAFVIIQHLAPGHKSIMDSLLKKYTQMEVVQVTDGMKMQPNCVYLNPPDKDIDIMNRCLYLTERGERRGVRLPIDHFFRSLAADQGEKAICVVLSGTGTDGTLGLKAIKGAGGMAMAQDESQARYDSMPKSAIDTGLVDFVLPVEEMFAELVKYAQHPYVGGVEEVPTAKRKFADYLAKIFVLVRAQTGHDFSHYKQNTIRRRIERRMAVHQIDEVSDYVRYLQKNSAEVETLFKDMLITVTNFFRDPEAFDVLGKKVVPMLIEGKTAEDSVRIWVPGCATGEEAYSIAMLIAEQLSKVNKHVPIQVFATDIDQDAIEYARQGVYPDSIAADVTPERLLRFFIKEESSYRVKKQVRETVVFATQNLIKDAPFSKLDMVSCRNVLIYMDAVLQKKIIPLFHYTLNPGGFMFLGTSETLGDFAENFATISAKWKLFKRKETVAARGPAHPVVPLYAAPAEEEAKAAAKKPLTETGIRQVAERMILQNYAPPCVLINDKHEILYFHGKTEKFLAPPTGQATFDILKMARDELHYKMSTIIHRAIKEKRAVTAKDLQVRYNDELITIDLIARPVPEDAPMGGLMMVIFETKTPPGVGAAKTKKARAAGKTDPRVTSLEQELQSTREYLQTTVEELETSNEELKSTNEELQSTNEELQSTNEELETSREELQSTNEELETVNSELQDKVNQLSVANDDLNNLLASTDIATIFLDMDLCVKRFTPAMSSIFNLIQSDRGRPISDITSNLHYPNILEDARETLRTLIPKEIDVETSDGHWYTVRILPYRTVENVINGIVITFADVTRQVEQAEEMRQTLELKRLAAVVKDSNDAITVQDIDGTITAWNRGAEKMYGYTESEALGMNIKQIVPKDRCAEAVGLIREIASGREVESLETKRLCKGGKVVDVWLTVTKLVDEDGKIVSVATTERDITEFAYLRKRREDS